MNSLENVTTYDMLKYIIITTWKEFLIIFLLAYLGYNTICTDIFFACIMSVCIMSFTMNIFGGRKHYLLRIMSGIIASSIIYLLCIILQAQYWYTYICISLIVLIVKKIYKLDDYIDAEIEKDKNSKGVFR